MVYSPAQSIKILFIAAEADPFIKVGGLGDYAGSLPLALRNLPPKKIQNLEIDIRLVLPFHGKIPAKKRGIRFLTKFSVIEKGKPVLVKVHFTQIEGLPVYLISRNRRESKSTSVYSEKPYQISRKYAFFSVASLELLKNLHWKADIVHANDWHTAFSILRLCQLKQTDPFYKNIKTLLTIHNLAYMGGGSETTLKSFHFEAIRNQNLPTWAKTQPFPMGLALADEIVAVSPSYSKEITTPQFGYGLEKLLLQRGNSIFGILNGIDYQKWDPQNDKCVDNPFSVKTILKRFDNKRQIQKKLGLVYGNDQIPLITIISRLDIQKGIDLLIEGFISLKDIPMQLVILGIGNKLIEKDCVHLEKIYPKKVRAIIRYDGSTARKLYGGADMILIPSRFEPCGTTQMIAMRYGCIPIARATGGLKDSIQNERNGFLFKDATALALVETLIKAIDIFQNEPDRWRKMQIQAMNSDFSWNNSALLYARRYIDLLST